MEKSLTLELHKLFNSQRRFKYPLEKEEKNAIPKNGIYIFFEKGETYETPEGEILDRIVRVGIHKKDGLLRSRLNQHFKGNSRASSFRRYVGQSIQNKKGIQNKGKLLEQEISIYMQKNLSFVVFEVEEKDRRISIESKIISTLSNDKTIPSKDWLGNYSIQPKIKESGLWLVQELYKENLTQEEFEELKQIVLS